ncbi:MAG: YggT family protein [bacterium]|nr:YggT family protein [bacterium]
MNEAIRAVNSILTLYMLLVMIRWLGPWLELDLRNGRLRWIPAITDPVIAPIRGLLPATGPLDLGPPAVLFALWIGRTIVVGLLIAMAARSVGA